MLVQSKPCPYCGHRNVADAGYCGNCEASLPVQQTQAIVGSVHNQQMPSHGAFQALASVADDLEFLEDQIFQAKDRLKQGSLLWLLFGRHKFRRELGRQVDETFVQVQATWQTTYLRWHEQQAAYLLRRQQQQYDFEARYAEFLFKQKLLDEAVERQFMRLAKIVDLINRLFVEEGRLAGLPPEMQQEIAMFLIRQAERLCLEINQLLDGDSLDYLEEDF